MKSKSVTPFPWAEAMAFGFGVLRLSTRQFWAMTPREIKAASDGVFGRANQPMQRESLDRLMAIFPDNAANRSP